MKVIKIGATWCGSCLEMKKIIEEVQLNFPDVEFISWDIDFDSEKVKEYENSDLIPYIILTEDSGEEIERLVGDSTKEEITNAINKYL